MNPLDITAQAIEAQLKRDLTPSELWVIDESADHAGHAGTQGAVGGTHFRVRIATTRFLGLTRVAQHRLVYDSLRAFTDAGLHALAIEVLAAAPTQNPVHP
jgi:BolA protein